MSGDRDERAERLKALWVRHLAGEHASESAAAELADEVRAGGPLADALAADDLLHRQLDALGRGAHDEQAFVDQVGRLVAAEASSDRFVSAVERHLDAAEAVRGRRRQPAQAAPVVATGRRRRWALAVAAPVVALAAAAALALWVRSEGRRNDRAPEASAERRAPTVASGTLAVAGGARLALGEVVPEGTVLASDQGRACVRLADTSEICLERATRVQLAARDGRGRLRIALEAGKVAAAVSHQRPGETFTIGAATGDVTAVGTAFSVDLAGDGAAMVVRVVEGAVRVERRAPARGAAEAPVLLRAHRALAAATGSNWRMTSEEERDEWSLVRAHTARVPAVPPTPQAPSPPATDDRSVAGGEAAAAAPGDEVSALLALADALRARGRLRDARGICDGLARRFPGRPEVERVVAELRLPPPAQPWNATPAVYRINAGGDRYVDPRGNVWAADTHAIGGHSGEIDEEIDGTDMDPLYRSERFAFPGERLSYHLPIADGDYVVRLHFAEIWAGTIKRNMRKFDVTVEGDKVLAAYDIAAEAGPMTATVQQVVTTVRDGSLDLEFAHVVENPKLSALEVFALAPGEAPPPAPAPPTVFPPLPLPPTDALYRVNAGGREFVDPEGRRWEADGHFNDTGLGAAIYAEIAGTDLDPLYQTERRSFVTRRNLVYSFPLPPGRYLARLHFAVLHPSSRVGIEIFDVLLEQSPVLKGLNVFAEVGMFNALVKEVETTVTDGALDLSFRPIKGRPNISAIEILPLHPTPAGCNISRRPADGSWLLIVLIALFRIRVRGAVPREAGGGGACGGRSTR